MRIGVLGGLGVLWEEDFTLGAAGWVTGVTGVVRGVRGEVEENLPLLVAVLCIKEGTFVAILFCCCYIEMI